MSRHAICPPCLLGQSIQESASAGVQLCCAWASFYKSVSFSSFQLFRPNPSINSDALKRAGYLRRKKARCVRAGQSREWAAACRGGCGLCGSWLASFWWDVVRAFKNYDRRRRHPRHPLLGFWWPGGAAQAVFAAFAPAFFCAASAWAAGNVVGEAHCGSWVMPWARSAKRTPCAKAQPSGGSSAS